MSKDTQEQGWKETLRKNWNTICESEATLQMFISMLLAEKESKLVEKILNANYKWVNIDDGNGNYISFDQLRELLLSNNKE